MVKERLGTPVFSEILPSKSWRPGPGKVGQGGLKALHLWYHLQKICIPKSKNIFSSASYKTCRIFWDFDWVGSAYRSGEIPTQSHMRFGVFFLGNPQKRPDAKVLMDA